MDFSGINMLIDNEDRTLYTLVDECGEETTITLDKFVADILQNNITDVHKWVQDTYIQVAERRPQLGRRQKGDLVRALSFRKALQFLEKSGELDDF